MPQSDAQPPRRDLSTDDPFASVWDEESLARQRRLLRRVTEIADSIGVALYLDSGTLIGHVRQGGILPWDDDLDLSLPDGARKLGLGAAIAAAGLQWRFIGSETFMQVYDPSHTQRDTGGTWPFVDIFIFHPEGDALVGSFPTLRLPRDIILPGRRTTFEGVACWEPEKPLAVLDTMYPGWRRQEVTSLINHREGVYTEGIALRRIRTDAAGRKIDHDAALIRVPRRLRSRRPCLVVVRASGQARYKTWMRKGAPRAWDLMVNYPDGDPLDDDVANYIVIGGSAKYPTAKELYYAESWFMRDRKAVLFLDDDIDVAFGDLDRLFQTFLACELWLGQPSWAPGSPAGTTVTLRDARSEAHYTNFVDPAAALFSQSALAACVDSFDQPADADALSSLWPKLLSAPFDRVGVIDAVSVRQAEGAAPRAGRTGGGAEVLGFVKRDREVLQKFKTTG